MPKPHSKQKTKKSPHRSFHRTYYEETHDDYVAPSLFALTADAFSHIFKNWKLFLPLIALTTVIVFLFIGFLSQDTIEAALTAISENSDYIVREGASLGLFAQSSLLLISTISTAGLTSDLTSTSFFLLALIFLILFLISIFIIRKSLSGEKVSLRDALYTSMTPFLSCFTILLVILVELLPLIIILIVYKSALDTDFLSTPFYALIFIAFAGALSLLSAYLLSSSTIALVATSAPGLYPKKALSASRDFITGRRLIYVVRLLYLILAVAVITVIIMLPIILIDTALKSSFSIFASLPIVPIFLFITTCFNFVFISIYLYLFYRSLLDYETKNQ